MDQINIDELIKNFSKVSKRNTKKIAKMYFSILSENIVNGYGAYMLNGVVIRAVMKNKKSINVGRLSKKELFVNGRKVMALNTSSPNEYLTIIAMGNKARIAGMKFKASSKLAKDCSKMSYSGKKYMKYE